MCTFFFNTHSTIALRQPNPLTTHQHKRRNSARFRSPPNSRQSLPPTPRVLSPSSRSLLYGSSIGMGLFRPFLASIDKPSQSNSEKCKACLALHSRDELFKIQQERERWVIQNPAPERWVIQNPAKKVAARRQEVGVSQGWGERTPLWRETKQSERERERDTLREWECAGGLSDRKERDKWWEEGEKLFSFLFFLIVCVCVCERDSIRKGGAG